MLGIRGYLWLLAGTLAWNLASTGLLLRRREAPRSAKRLYLVALPTMLLGLVADIGGMDPRTPEFLAIGWLYPLSFFLATAGIYALFRGTQKRLPLALTTFNGLLGIVYLTRYLTYLYGELGLPIDALLVSHAMVQSLAIFFLYIFFPILNPLPILWLPLSAKRGWQRTLHAVPSFLCGLYVLLLLLLYPRGYQIAQSWRLAPETPTRRPALQAGVVIRVRGNESTEDLQRDAEALRALGVKAVNLFVAPELMGNEEAERALDAFIGRLRKEGFTIVLTADYPGAWISRPPNSREEVLRTMLPFHEFLAKRYQPDILVPFIEPYGAFVVVTRMTLPADEWMAMLEEVARALRSEAPEVKIAVYFMQTERDRALYERVTQAHSPVQVTGFSLYAVFQTRHEMEQKLRRMEDWMKKYGHQKEHWIFETGQSPLTMGGERAQRGFLKWVSEWANRQQIRGIFVFGLMDYAEKVGLLSARGRPRLAFHFWSAFAR